jgi:predicted flap endonuclease-1-like 5' DNA nuclease
MDTLWVIILFIVGLLLGVLIGWLIWGRKAKACEDRVRELEGTLRERAGQIKKLEASAQALQAAANPDDLTRLEGIGPKMQSLLRETKIYTYQQLAAADVDQLQQMVRDAGLAMTDPSSWPEQAKLAAEAKWDELQALQDELKGGRRA